MQLKRLPRSKRTLIPVVAALGILILTSGRSQAAIITPAGLNPGDEFRLAFVSSTMPGLVSSDIADYDAHIQGLAGAAGLDTYGGGAVAWQVIGSTATVNANDAGRLPASETVPIYLVSGGVLVDGGGADLWDGSIDAAFNVTETGEVLLITEQVATGTFPDGSAADDPLGLSDLAVGFTSATDSSWVYFTENGIAGKRLYGVSQVLTVVPEPGTLALVGFGALGLTGRRRRA